MIQTRRAIRRNLKPLVLALLGGGFLTSFIDSCDDKLINATRYFDPCGTFLANCTPGSFITNAAAVGDYCVDPACTVPGGCGVPGPALGTQTNLCP